MDKDNLLRRAYRLLDGEHQITSVEVGEALPTNERFHTDSCDVCDLLREIDESLKPVGSICDCHPVSGEYGHERGFLREDRPVD